MMIAAAALPLIVFAAALVSARRRRTGRERRMGVWLVAGAAAAAACAYSMVQQSTPAEAITAARGVIPGRAIIEGFTVRTKEGGHRELVLHFRPLTELSDHRVWIHAYAPGRHDYTDLVAVAPQITDWRRGEMSRQVFDVPAGSFNLYAGVAAGGDLGPAHPLGMIPPLENAEK